MLNAKFIHLRTHTSYSLLEGALRIDEAIKLCNRYAMPALAITDNSNLFGSLDFSTSLAKAGIQPIIGVSLNLSTIINKQQEFSEILLIAKNQLGYQNLLKLVSFCYTKNNDQSFKYIEFNDLKNHAEGLIALSAFKKGIIGKNLINNNFKKAELLAQEFQTIFKQQFYFEIIRTEIDTEFEEKYIELAYKLEIPIVATNDVYYANKEMHQAHEALLCIADGAYMADENRRRVSDESYFKSQEEMCEIFKDLPEALENSINIAKSCHVMSEPHAPMLPNFAKDEDDLLTEMSNSGLENRLKLKFEKENLDAEQQQKIREEYFARLEYELGIITSMNFSGYFLIVSDFIKWSKENNIPVGPGRGSGAGSIIAWSLLITDLDPIRFGLFFERFLNPERISMPDFDIDFCQERREEVINYVRDKYGEHKVGQIITFGKLQARAVIRDVGRVLQIPYPVVDRISKLVPFNAINPVTLSQALELVPELSQARKDDEQIGTLINIALQLEGLSRHASTHAAGIVIAGKDLVEIVPLYRDDKSDMNIVQYSMKHAETAGLVKFDFLGLKTLTTIAKTLDLIQKNENITLNLEKLDFNDKDTYSLLAAGKSIGVFQLESPGMRDSLCKMRPDCIEDIIALGALYRPGPMENIPTYIARKHGLEEPDYLHDKLENILKETYGIIIYQEQVMEIAKVLSGYSLGSADLLRKAMGKKIKAEMDAQRDMFVSGAVKNKVSASQANSIFDSVAKFAGYGFNKAHASAYGLISYQTAYLKANFTIEFLVASINLDIHDTDKINIFIQDAKNFDIEILPPDINSSHALFSTIKIEGEKKIVFGLSALKNVGLAAVEAIIEERNKNGRFTSIFNLMERVSNKQLNKRLLESLIKAGALDSVHKNRKQLLNSVALLLDYGALEESEAATNQTSLFGDNIDKIYPALPELEDYISDEKANLECEAMGFYLNNHPLEEFTPILKNLKVNWSRETFSDLEEGYTNIKLAAVILSSKSKLSPKGRFYILQLSDPSGMYEATLFNSDVINESADLLNSKLPMLFQLDARKDEGGLRLSINKISFLSHFIKNNDTQINIHLKNLNSLPKIGEVLQANSANEASNATKHSFKIALIYKEDYKIIIENISCNINADILKKIENHCHKIEYV